MADEEVQTTEEQTTETQAAETQETSQASAEGTASSESQLTAEKTEASESWRDSLPDDLKEWANKFDSPTTALKSYRELEKRMGRSIALPGKDATPEEVQEFRKKALGIPDDISEYKLELPENAPEEVRKDPLSDPVLKEFVEASHAQGKSPDQVQNDVNYFYKVMEKFQEQAAEQQAKLVQQSDEALTREWGSEKEANLTYARRAIKQFDADGQFSKFLDEAQIGGIPAGSHPEFVRLFAKVGRRLAEDTVQLEPTEDERRSYQDQAAEARKRRDEALAKGDRAAAQRFDEMEREIYGKMNGRQPIVGQAGRSA